MSQTQTHNIESPARRRSERRISVRLPLRVTGKDARGFAFEEDTASENLCRGGAAFRTRFDVAVGSNLQIRIPLQGSPLRREDNDFETRGRVVHVSESQPDGERLVGVQFVGPRFRRMFSPETGA
jgi:PilZ domain